MNNWWFCMLPFAVFFVWLLFFAETDSTGKTAPVGTVAQRRSLIIGMGMLALAGILAVVLLIMLLHP